MADSVQKELEAERLATLYSTLGPELTARMMSDKEPSPEDLAQFMKLLGGEAEGREDSLLESLMAGSSASADPSAVSSAEIDPIPGFVVKTLLLERKEGWVSGLKVLL